MKETFYYYLSELNNILIDFVQANALRLIWVVLLFVFSKIVLRRTVVKILRLVNNKVKAVNIKALVSIAAGVGNVVIYIVIFAIILDLFGVDIRPILAGMGVIGLAASFGAQSLVKDFIAGIFILIENQYALGDKVKISGFEGEVIKISMRSTMLRDESGKIIYISNGSITSVENFSR